MNTKTRKTNNGNTKGEPKSFTPQEVEALGIEGPRSRPGGQGRVGPLVRRLDPERATVSSSFCPRARSSG